MKKYVVNGKDLIADAVQLSPVPVLCITEHKFADMIDDIARLSWWDKITGETNLVIGGCFVNPSQRSSYTNPKLPDSFIWINPKSNKFNQFLTLRHEIQHVVCYESNCHCQGSREMEETHAVFSEFKIIIQLELARLLVSRIKFIQYTKQFDDYIWATVCRTIAKLRVFQTAFEQYQRNKCATTHHSKWEINWESIRKAANDSEPHSKHIAPKILGFSRQKDNSI